MNDQILTGTNPAADARLIADVMQAPSVKREPKDHSERMHAAGIEAGIVAVIKDLTEQRRKARASGDNKRADGIDDVIGYLWKNVPKIHAETVQVYGEGFDRCR